MVVDHPSKTSLWYTPNVIISMGVTVMEETFLALDLWPKVPLYCYNWDCYEWVWTRPRPGEYDYKRYGELLSRAREIWVPSHCTGVRTTQWWGLKNWHVVLSAVPYWDWEYKEVATGAGTGDSLQDGGYAFCALREIPDQWWGVFEECCAELKIPYVCTKHERSYTEYQRAVAHCRFLVSPLYELSTGGLSLLEGYYLGKPCLLSDSEWHGGRDYLGGRAHYFKFPDKEDFKRQLLMLYSNQQPVEPDHKEWVEKNFSDQRMIDDMLAAIGID